ncbi:unnamed protein product [Adineta steineri]|uniref:Uncharacterized protein n=1 Tax=Adineta steineri TaxID=433720 RepID=A0A813MA04_9BILA|nr:unnamed protein product [Adineta steineri]CAF3538929.1 unnamed protein product [Adineta steineri]
MSDLSGQCEDELCLKNQSNHIVRVFPCLYHCKKMLCIKHLSEHDKYIEKQIQCQKQLEYVWNNYILLFNEDKIEEEFQKLKNKLEKYRELNESIQNLLLIKNFHNSTENNQKIRMAIEKVQQAIEEEKQLQSIVENINPKIESVMNHAEENQRIIDFVSLPSSITTNDGSETIDSLPSILNTNGNSLLIEQENGYVSYVDPFNEYRNSIESENEDNTMDDSSLNKVEINHTNNVTPNRSIIASKLRGCCPLTHDGVFGINCHKHGIRLCPSKPSSNQRTYRLHHHFRRVHHLTSFASLALARAIGAGQDPMTTRLFDDHHIILNIDELRTVNCPIHKPFVNYPLLQIENTPCDTIKQVRHLKDHLKRAHRFTNKAANFIIKAVKDDMSVHMIQFPQWIDIIEDDNHF